MNSNTLGFVVWVDENGNGVVTDATDGNVAVDAGEQILLRGAAPGARFSCRRTAATSSFTDGVHAHHRRAAIPPNAPCCYCDDRGRRIAAGTLSSARVVLIARVGRAQVLSESGPVNT